MVMEESDDQEVVSLNPCTAFFLVKLYNCCLQRPKVNIKRPRMVH